MINYLSKYSRLLYFIIILLFSNTIFSQIVTVGSGSYTTSFPGTDAAGRNSFPSGSPQLSGLALGKPVPTNDWWSALIKENHASNLFNYPMAMKTTTSGLVVSYIPWGVFDDQEPIVVGVTGLNASKATVSNHTDWTVTMDWNDATRNFEATSGIAMPFVYFHKKSTDVAQVTVNLGTVTITNEILIVENARSDADFVFYAPVGSTWTQNGKVYTSTLNNKNYWSMTMLPLTTSNVATVATEYKKYAYVFPTNTTANWTVNNNTGVVKTDFVVTTETKEGTETKMLIGLLPHQWANLSTGSPAPNKYTYSSIRGDIKTLEGNSFSVENKFKGILPTLPYLANYSTGFSPSELDAKIGQIKNDELAEWTDSYNEGQVMNRLIQTARIADQTGDVEALNKMVATIKNRLENWLKYQTGEKAFLFYYNSNWSTLIGYPAGHGQDSNINDHHFHWGYFIHAAAFMEQFEPGWANQWGSMINLLVRDAASPNRNDTQFPFLRNFSPYAGHCWANGFASFPQGNDQESTSESMQFNSSLIHWGTITGNDEIRDLGIYLYTTEQTAIEEYWFDMNNRNFKPDQKYGLVSRVWGNSYDNGTFWTADITASYGIEMYPIHGGSLYLGHNTNYVQKIWDELKVNTEILSSTSINPNLWHDTFWKYLSFLDPAKAIELYNSYPNRMLKFGISDAQTYHWVHVMNALGKVKPTITANYPIAATFEKNGALTYVAHNYSNSPITVNFSDGYQLQVPARKMATNRDASVSGIIASDFNQAFTNGSVNLNVTTSGSGVSKVEFYDGTKLLGEVTTAPYKLKATNLGLGMHGMYAKVYEGSKFNVTNIVTIQVGDQLPYTGNAFAIPGIIEPGNYDKFEGGVGQHISYLDLSQINEGGFRPTEYVDAATVANEGETVGWIQAGEWLEYTVNVAEAGLYSLSFRYASGNPSGGGPFHLLLDGKVISNAITVPSTSTTSWNIWATKTVTNIPLTPGIHVLRINFSAGEFNLGRMTFSKTGSLTSSYPTAVSGSKLKVLLPSTTATLDGSGSTESAAKVLTYSWSQIYGPSVIQFSDSKIAKPVISGLEEGMYKLILTVTNTDGVSDEDKLLVLVTATANSAPTVSLLTPLDNTTYTEGTSINISANASDFDGSIQKVEFYANNTLISTDTTAPYSAVWNPSAGNYILTAKATDDGGALSTSQSVTITVATKMACTQTSTLASEGTFSVGYKSTFETVGSNVTITFELLDNDKSGVVAYLFKESPFSETPMVHVSGNIFSKTLSGFTAGSTISYACKFAYAGGQSVTKYISYVVGTDCSGSGGTNDVTPPVNFTATLGAVSDTSVELLLNATDASGIVVYKVSYGNKTETISTPSGVQKSMLLSALTPNTAYTFNVSVSDLAGNNAANNPIVISATTLKDSNTECAGSSSLSQQGSFNVGYKYSFETIGTSVKINFELLDDKSDLIAYLWKQSPFAETQMTKVSGKLFTATVTGQTVGSTISYACKFAFAGGLAVTKYFTYVVGNTCAAPPLDSDGDSVPDNLDLCPNTPAGQSVNANGCSNSQLDDDKDGIMNDKDLCPNTSTGQTVDANGCSTGQLDDDKDGIPNSLDQCPNTPVGINVDYKGCPILSPTNFKLEVINPTCQTKNNGKVKITGTATYNYTATMDGKDYTFTNNVLEIADLAPKVYTICVKVPALNNYTQCFDFEVKGAPGLGARTTMDTKGNSTTANIEIESGTAPYFIEVNGKIVEITYDKSISLAIQNGDLLVVKSSVACEGSISEKVILFNELTAYPNPTSNFVEVFIPTTYQKNSVMIQVVNNIGKTVLSKEFKIQDYKIVIPMEILSTGLYVIHIQLEKPQIIKVIKK